MRVADLGRFGGGHRIAKTVLAERNLIKWFVTGAADIGYLGWINQQNIGDDAIFSSHVRSAPARRFRGFPLTSLGLSVLTKKNVRVNTVLLGGGTVIGLDGWAHRVRRVLREIEYRDFVVFGPGVEEITFGVQSGRGSTEGIEIWQEVLSKAKFVGVRGPRSQAILAEWGIESVVVGDPALCVPLTGSEGLVSQEKLISLNVTNVRATLPAIAEWRETLCRGVSKLCARGARIAVYGMDEGDVEETVRQLSLFGVRPCLVIGHRRIDPVIGLLRRSSLVVSERLHGAIFAANLGVPFIHLGYRPKAHDFAESISAQDQVLGGSAPSIDQFIDMSEWLMSDEAPTHKVELDALRRTFAKEHGRHLDS